MKLKHCFLIFLSIIFFGASTPEPKEDQLVELPNGATGLITKVEKDPENDKWKVSFILLTQSESTKTTSGQIGNKGGAYHISYTSGDKRFNFYPPQKELVLDPELVKKDPLSRTFIPHRHGYVITTESVQGYEYSDEKEQWLENNNFEPGTSLEVNPSKSVYRDTQGLWIPVTIKDKNEIKTIYLLDSKVKYFSDLPEALLKITQQLEPKTVCTDDNQLKSVLPYEISYYREAMEEIRNKIKKRLTQAELDLLKICAFGGTCENLETIRTKVFSAFYTLDQSERDFLATSCTAFGEARTGASSYATPETRVNMAAVIKVLKNRLEKAKKTFPDAELLDIALQNAQFTMYSPNDPNWVKFLLGPNEVNKSNEPVAPKNEYDVSYMAYRDQVIGVRYGTALDDPELLHYYINKRPYWARLKKISVSKKNKKGKVIMETMYVADTIPRAQLTLTIPPPPDNTERAITIHNFMTRVAIGFEHNAWSGKIK